MSIPRLGIINEVKGVFYQEFEKNQERDLIKISLKPNTLKISEPYKELIKQKKIVLEWRLRCDSTFFEEFPKDDIINLELSNLHKKCEIIYYLRSLEDFIFKSNTSFETFYDQDYSVKKGEILSVEKKDIFYANRKDSRPRYAFVDIEYIKDIENPDKKLEFHFDGNLIKVFTYNNKKIRNDFRSFDKNSSYTNINRQLLLSSVIIKAIQWIGKQLNDNVNPEYDWVDYIKEKIFELEPQENQDDEEEFLKEIDFDIASNLYYKIFTSLDDVYDDLKKIEDS